MRRFNLRIPITASAITVALIISGCASERKTVNVAQPDPALKLVAEASREMTAQLKILSAIEQEAKGVYPVLESGPTTGPLAQSVTLKWSGEAGRALRGIATKAGYSMRIIGKPPASPLIVTIDATNRKLFDVVQDIGHQVGENGVQIDEINNSITLVYRDSRK